MTIVRAAAVLAMDSGDSLDNVVNVWHFETASPVTVGTCSTIGTQLSYFYQALAPLMSKHVASSAAEQHEVILSSVTPGGPGREDDMVSKVIWRTPFSLSGATAGTGLPAEVAIALSFRASLVGFPEEASGGTIRPASRRRGRVFLGPFSTGISDNLGTTCRVDTSQLVTVLTAYAAMVGLMNDNADAPVYHVVYSPSNGVANIVEYAWIDDAFDTVRSRGVKSTGRIDQVLEQMTGP